MNVSTQLRLITKTEAPVRKAVAPTPAPEAPARPLRGRVSSPRRPAGRRAAHWHGQWRLDERTREIGKAGVASARAALAAAHADDLDQLRQAS